MCGSLRSKGLARQYDRGTTNRETVFSSRDHGEPLRGSIDSEAVEQARAARAHKIVLAAALTCMGRIPGPVAGADAVGMSNLSAAWAVARPVIAGVVLGVGIGLSVRLRARQHIVRVRSVANAVHHLTLLIQRRLLKQIAAETGEFQRVSVQIGLRLSDRLSASVVPGTLPNAITRIDRGLIILG